MRRPRTEPDEDPATLSRRFDVALLDLDGVVYVGDQAVAHAAPALAAARADGMRLAFVTNNAARPPEVVARRLTEFAVAADPGEVITSAQTAAHYLAQRLRPGAAVLVVGAEGLHAALRERGLVPVTSADADPEAVVQGFGPHTDWAMLSEAAIAIRRGLLWVATNLDRTVPSPRGPLPGNGALVAVLQTATGRSPIATGKPEPTMHQETVDRTHARAPLIVGDRLDTDIEGARRVGCPSLLVLTGVTGPAELVCAPAEHRPDFIGADLRALVEPYHPAQAPDPATWTCGRWRAQRTGAGWTLTAGPAAAPPAAPAQDEVLALRAVVAAAWAGPAGPWTGADATAQALLTRWQLPCGADGPAR